MGQAVASACRAAASAKAEAFGEDGPAASKRSEDGWLKKSFAVAFN